MTCSDASSICAGIGRCGMTDVQRPQRRQGTGPARRHCPWSTNLSASSWRAESAARNSGDAPKRISPLPESFSARSSAPKAHLDLFEPGRRVVGLDFGRDTPRWIVALALLSGRRGERYRAFEARRAGIEIQHAVEIGQERALARIDIEMNAGAVAVGPLPRRDPKRVARARQHEVAVAADRAGQRTHVAAEGDVVQFERAAAVRIMQGDAAGEIEPVDRQRTQIDLPGRCRPIDAALRIEPEIERDAVDRQFGGTDLAAHQRAERRIPRRACRRESCRDRWRHRPRPSAVAATARATAARRACRRHGPACR